MSIWKYHRFLPYVEEACRFTRGEGGTPLVRSVNIAGKLGVRDLYFKLENLNPTGSYKDRFAAIVTSQHLLSNSRVCVTTSSGNTGAALVAYCAAARIRCVVITVDGAPADKLLQMQAYGAEIYEVELFGKDANTTSAVFDRLEVHAAKGGSALPISAYRYCPDGMRGVETIAYEILEHISAEHIFSPAGGGGLTLSIAKGSGAFVYDHMLPAGPRIHCVQPVGNDTIVTNLNAGSNFAESLSSSTTSISGLQVPAVLDGDGVIEACRQSGGHGHLVEDEEVYFWQSELAVSEGIFCEPAGAVALAGLSNAVKKNLIDRDARIVCLVTGSGFKNISAVKKHFRLKEVQKINVDRFAHLMEHSIKTK